MGTEITNIIDNIVTQLTSDYPNYAVYKASLRAGEEPLDNISIQVADTGADVVVENPSRVIGSVNVLTQFNLRVVQRFTNSTQTEGFHGRDVAYSLLAWGNAVRIPNTAMPTASYIRRTIRPDVNGLENLNEAVYDVGFTLLTSISQIIDNQVPEVTTITAGADVPVKDITITTTVS